MSWQISLIFTGVGALTAIIFFLAVTDPIRQEMRQIRKMKKRRAKMRANWKEINECRPGAFMINNKWRGK
jgi:hypothetical protein